MQRRSSEHPKIAQLKITVGKCLRAEFLQIGDDLFDDGVVAVVGLGEQFVLALRHHLRVGIRGRLDAREADRREALDERALDRRGHERGFVLQAVACETLAERHRHIVDIVNGRV